MAHNYGELAKLWGLKIGDVVFIDKAGDEFNGHHGVIYDAAENDKGFWTIYIERFDGYRIAKNARYVRRNPYQHVKVEKPKMKTVKMSFGKGLTLNTGNYNSLRLDVLLEIELDGEDNVAAAFQYARAEANVQLETAIMDTDLPEQIKLTHVAQLRKNS